MGLRTELEDEDVLFTFVDQQHAFDGNLMNKTGHTESIAHGCIDGVDVFFLNTEHVEHETSKHGSRSFCSPGLLVTCGSCGGLPSFRVRQVLIIDAKNHKKHMRLSPVESFFGDWRFSSTGKEKRNWCCPSDWFVGL